MPNEFELIRSVNRRLLSNIARKREEGVERVQALNAQMAELKKLLENLDYQRSQIEAAEKLQAAFLSSDHPATEPITSAASSEEDPTDTPESEDIERGKLKARIGDQRYVVLSTIREHGALSLNGAIFVTGLPAKRVKDAIKADFDLGVLKEDQYFMTGGLEAVYSLTDIGTDLLERFEAYKRQKGQKLPTQAEVLRELGLEPPQDLENAPFPNSPEDYGVVRTIPPDEQSTSFFGDEVSDTGPEFGNARETGH